MGRCGLIVPMKFPFQNVALIGKHKAPEIAGPLLRLAAFLSSKGLNVVVDSLTAEQIESSPYPAMNLNEMAHAMDLAIVIGGDGTMLNIARTLSPHQVPLVGVNQGRLGFLTDLTLENMQDSMAAMLDGKFITEQRLLLSARGLRDIAPQPGCAGTGAGMPAYAEQPPHRGERLVGTGDPDAPYRRYPRALRQPYQLRPGAARQDHRH